MRTTFPTTPLCESGPLTKCPLQRVLRGRSEVMGHRRLTSDGGTRRKRPECQGRSGPNAPNLATRWFQNLRRPRLCMVVAQLGKTWEHLGKQRRTGRKQKLSRICPRFSAVSPDATFRKTYQSPKCTGQSKSVCEFTFSRGEGGRGTETQVLSSGTKAWATLAKKGDLLNRAAY